MQPGRGSDTIDLAAVFRAIFPNSATLTIHERREGEFGTHGSQLVRVSTDHADRWYFVKQATDDVSHTNGTHRRGIAHEARVYRDVLDHVSVPTAGFFGCVEVGDLMFLVTEALCEHRTLNRLAANGVPAALADTAEWLAMFQLETAATSAGADTLATASADGFARWVERTQRMCPTEHRAWADVVCAAAIGTVDEFLADASPVSHGEFYASNVLYLDGDVRPIDWESAWRAPGEMDLVQLLDGWPEPQVRHAQRRYAAARWPDGRPDCLERRLALASIYVHFHWFSLAEKPLHRRVAWNLRSIREAAVSLGWL